MIMQDCVRRNLDFIDHYRAGARLPIREIENFENHHDLLFPETIPPLGTRLSVREKTGVVHSVFFSFFNDLDLPDDTYPLDALSFDPKIGRANVGAGYLKPLSANTIRIGFFESITFDLEKDRWIKSGHEKVFKSYHPLIDSAIGSWKFDAHMKDAN